MGIFGKGKSREEKTAKIVEQVAAWARVSTAV